MKPCNLLVHSSGAFALYKNGSDNIKAITNLKNNEIIVLKEMCDILCGAGCEVSVFEGYFVGYTIDQISYYLVYSYSLITVKASVQWI